MIIGGLEPFSLMDFPGHLAAVVFTQGCNFRCPFCHNGGLIPFEPDAETQIPEQQVRDLLVERQGRLDGLMVTGGEPTLQADLGDFLGFARGLGYETAIETNGSQPQVIGQLLADGLLDFIAMDIKAPLDGYDRLSGVRAPVESIQRSIATIAGSGLPHEFRTTVVPALLSDDDVEQIKRLVPEGSAHSLQEFKPEHALDPTLRDG